jgi:NADH-quinone oxidoreductase subunit M
MAALTSHLLTLLVATPLLGAAVLGLAGRQRPAAARMIALLASLLSLALAVPVWVRYDPAGAPWQLLEQQPLVKSLGIGFIAGADGLTVVLVWLIALGVVAAIVSSWSRVRDGAAAHYAALLIAQAAMTGVAVALDGLLFILCWTILLVTLGVLQARRLPIVLAVLSSASLAAGFVLVFGAARTATGVPSFDIGKLQQLALPADRQLWPFLWFLGAFGLAAWQAAAGLASPSADGPRGAARAVVLLVALLGLPVHGLVRLNLALLPQAARTFVPLLAGLAAVTFVLGTVHAVRAREWRRLLAGVALCQLALAVLGLSVIDPGALAGSLLQPAAIGLALAPLLAATGFVTNTPAAASAAPTRPSSPLAGVVACVVLLAAAIALPGLSGFAGAASIVRGVSRAHPSWAYAAGAGLVVLAGIVVRQAWAATRQPLGPAAGWTRAEVAVLIAFSALVAGVGLAPAPLRVRLEPTMARVITRLDPGYAPAFAAVPGCGGPGSTAPAPSAPAGFTAIAPCDNPSSTPK